MAAIRGRGRPFGSRRRGPSASGPGPNSRVGGDPPARAPAPRGGLDPASAEDEVPLVEDRRLAGADARLGAREADGGPPSPCSFDLPGGARVAGPDLDEGFEPLPRLGGAPADPVRLSDGELPDRGLLPAPDDDGRGPRLERDDEPRPLRRRRKPPALPHREVLDPLVAPQDAPLAIDDRAGLRRHAPLPEERPVVAAGDEADLLRVLLVGDGEARLPGEGAHLLLGECPDRKKDAREPSPRNG